MVRRTSRGGRNAAENFVAPLRCLYRHAQRDGLIRGADNPALKVAKPRRLSSTRRALTESQLAETTTSAPPPVTTPNWTRCCTPRPPPAAAVPSTCGRVTSTQTSA
jgi:hypothetical protein